MFNPQLKKSMESLEVRHYVNQKLAKNWYEQKRTILRRLLTKEKVSIVAR